MATTNGCGYISSLRDFFFPFFILYNFFSRQYKAGKKRNQVYMLQSLTNAKNNQY
jgi:hypothetical protein